VGIHLGGRSIDVSSLDHRKNALMLVGDHLGIEQMAHLHLRHAQMRLADHEVMQALDSRAACRRDQGAVKLDVVFHELRDLAVLRDRGAKTVERSYCVQRHLAAFGEQTHDRPLDHPTRKVEIGDVGCIKPRYSRRLVPQSSQQSDTDELLDCGLCGGPRYIEVLCYRQLRERCPWRNGTFQDLALNFRAQCVDHRPDLQAHIAPRMD
jgi:hypothetical protein